MYDKPSKRDPLTVAIIAGLGAGIPTSFAVGLGQDPLVALSITVFAAVLALVCDRLGWV